MEESQKFRLVYTLENGWQLSFCSSQWFRTQRWAPVIEFLLMDHNTKLKPVWPVSARSGEDCLLRPTVVSGRGFVSLPSQEGRRSWEDAASSIESRSSNLVKVADVFLTKNVDSLLASRLCWIKISTCFLEPVCLLDCFWHGPVAPIILTAATQGHGEESLGALNLLPCGFCPQVFLPYSFLYAGVCWQPFSGLPLFGLVQVHSVSSCCHL